MLSASGWGSGCGEGSWMLIALMFESCVIDFLCLKDAITGIQLARTMREPRVH